MQFVLIWLARSAKQRLPPPAEDHEHLCPESALRATGQEPGRVQDEGKLGRNVDEGSE